MQNQVYDGSDSESGSGWIQWFCDLEGHEFFIEVDEDYISDNFNLHGLRERVSYFNEAMQMILSADSPDSEDLNDQNFLEIYQSAMDLYGLIHARFILTPRGLAMMKEKYMLTAFSYCPRVLCERHNVLPIGVSEELSTSRVKVYCPRCQDVYIPRQKQLDIDGAYFGTSFPHIFLKQFPELLPKGPAKFVPKIYGFKLFGVRGSKYALKHDYQGKPINEDEIREILSKGSSDAAAGSGIPFGQPTSNTSANQMLGQLKDTEMNIQSNSNMSNQMSKDQIGTQQVNPKTLSKPGHRRMASDDENMNGD